MNRVLCGVVLLNALIATASAADETVLEEVLISGEHAVWLLGTLSPL